MLGPARRSGTRAQIPKAMAKTLDGYLVGDAGFDLLSLAAPRTPRSSNRAVGGDRPEKPLLMASEGSERRVMDRGGDQAARLAMLAAAGWPMAELLNRGRCRRRRPRALTLQRPHLRPALRAVPHPRGARDEVPRAHHARQRRGLRRPTTCPATSASNSPRAAYPGSADEARDAAAEIKNGRLAMMAITGMSVQNSDPASDRRAELGLFHPHFF